MNGGRVVCPSGAGGAILHSVLWLTVRLTAGCLFAVALVGISGCARNEPVIQKSAPSIPIEEPMPPQAAQPDHVSTSLPAEPHLLEGSGVAVWAREFEGQLIAGLDENLYEPYRRITIERVQKALGNRGLYVGPVNGILDRPTMKSIYAFQEASRNLQRCGVPTPHTRKMLEQGSHTDLRS